MRTPDEMRKLILDFARQEEDIRLVGMEGSRVNRNIPKDEFQDYDITYFVKELRKFTEDDGWLSAFGPVLMMQKPEDMELFPAVEEGYSYLVLFEDYNKIDFTFLETDKLESYLAQDKLRTILLDKDGRHPEPVLPTDEEYWIRKPGPRSFDDCCNEFWNLTPYVMKGLCRREILFAVDHLGLLRDELLRMLSWQAGLEYGFSFSVGKNYKFIRKYLSDAAWKGLLATYRNDSYENMWEALLGCHTLFRDAAGKCAEGFGYPYPDYDRKVSGYVAYYYERFGRGGDEKNRRG